MASLDGLLSRASVALLGLGAFALSGCTSVLGTFETSDGAGGGTSSSAGSTSTTNATSSTVNGASASSTASGDPFLPRAFVTAEIFLGDFGTKGGGAALCLAAAAKAGLGGTWQAWTSEWGAVACSGGPWVLVNGEAKVGTCEQLLTNQLLHPIDVTESGEPVVAPLAVWTGLNAQGKPSGVDCGGWQLATGAEFGGTGLSSQTNAQWVEGLSLRCDKGARLYCFEQ